MADFTDFAKGIVKKPGQKRILSDRTTISVKSNGKVIRIGDLDNFTVSSRDSIRVFRPVGETREYAQYESRGYDISFSGGKVDWQLARLLHKQEFLFNNRKAGQQDIPIELFLETNNLKDMRFINPVFEIEHTVNHYNGNIESWVYEEVTLYGYSLTVDGDLEQLKESAKGFSPTRSRGGGSLYIDESLPFGAASVVDRIILDALKADDNRTSKVDDGAFKLSVNTPPRG
jgi:hypothetical protein